MLRLIIPKHVELNNFRLSVMFNFFQIATLALLTFRFFEARLWYRHMPIGHLMSADLWVKPGSLERLSEVWFEKEGGAVCSSPQDFDFAWGGEDSGFAFAGHECLPPCGVDDDRAWPRCVHEMETHRREAEDKVFFVTQFEERRIAADGVSTSSFAFVPLEEAHNVSLSYGFFVPVPWWPGSFSASQTPGKTASHEVWEARSDGSRSSERKGILTVLLDAGGKVRRSIEPQPTLDISLPELMEMAGASGATTGLDARNSEGGLRRITGLNVDIHIDCYQKQVEPLPGREDWTGPVCYARATRNPTKPWAAWEHVDSLGSDGTVRKRLHHGVRVRVIMGGNLDLFDANSLFLQLTASLVFLALPGKFMYFFINYALGHLSTIYRGVLIEPFDVQMECARLTARLMSNSVTFTELEDVKPASGKDVGCISIARVDEQLREVLRYRGGTLDEAEIASIVHFCHKAMMHINTLCRRVRPLKQLKGAFLERVGSRKYSGFGTGSLDMSAVACTKPSDSASGADPGSSGSGVINIDGFSMCCAATSQLEFESFVKLFDKDRGVTILEQFFLPPKLKPSSLLLEGEGQLFEKPRSGSFFNLHQRHRAEMDVLRQLCPYSSETPKHSLPTSSDEPVAGAGAPDPLGTLVADSPMTPPARQVADIPAGTPPILNLPSAPSSVEDPRAKPEFVYTSELS